MTIKIYTLQIKPFPKPRGQLGKHGNMTHSLNGYREWQADVITRLKYIHFEFPSEYFYLMYVLFLKSRRGQAPDCTNMIGGLEDTFVKGKFIKDDNWRLLPRQASDPIEHHTDFVRLVFLGDTEDVIYYFRNRERFITPPS